MLRCFVLLGILFLVGCSNAPPAVVAPTIDAGAASAAAITKYDKNGDGALDEAELKACPSLVHAKGRFDTNSDGKISGQEIAERIPKWRNVGIMGCTLTVMLDGKPLEGAEVKLIPEEWLQGALSNGSGKTEVTGLANISIAPADLPPADAGLNGMRLGLYKVEVTHPKVKLPARYNTATELGLEIAGDNPQAERERIELKSS